MIRDFGKISIAVLGFGKENQAVFEWLVEQGANHITICDKDVKTRSKNQGLFLKYSWGRKSNFKNLQIDFRLGDDYLSNLTNFDLIIRTPGIPFMNPEIQSAINAGVEVSSQMKLFFEYCPAKIIGITGTKGKGTTSSLIFEILNSNAKSKYQKSKVWLGGNIGNAPIEFLNELTKDDWVILELSSFQLQDLNKSPQIAVVLDIKSDHLDHHKNQNEYVNAKKNIVLWQSKRDFVIINADYFTSFEFATLTPSEKVFYFSRRKPIDIGSYVYWNNDKHDDGVITLRSLDKDTKICNVSDVLLRGEHNLENICAAVCAGYAAGASIESIKKGVTSFKGLEHRLELVDDIDGVKYYNDSFSTNPEPTIAAIKAFLNPKILILGGSEKKSNYTKLAKEIIKSNVKAIVSIGITGPKIVARILAENKKLKKASKIKIVENIISMREAVIAARLASDPGDVVVLSPASASFDMFENYKDRGNQFKSEVSNLKNSNLKL